LNLVRTEGIVLRATDFSETSQVVALCTLDRGQVHLLAKGSRRPRKDARGPFDLLTKCQVVFSTRARSGLYTATDWCMLRIYRRLRQDLDRFYAAMHACELALATTHEAEGEGGAYLALDGFLDRLDRGDDPALSRLLFEVRLLVAVGLAPRADACALCGGPLDAQARFSAASGGALCGACGATDASSCRVSLGALAALRRLCATHSNEESRLVLSLVQRDEIGRALREHIEYHLGRPLRTARYVMEDAPARRAKDVRA
jgi:DNA repair protein RecO (recombination protein O)